MAVRLYTTKTTVGAAISDAYAIFAELRDECQEQYDNMPEGLQESDRGQVLSTAADELGSHCDEALADDLPEVVSELPVEYKSNQRKNQTRYDRLDEALRMIEAALGALTDFADGDEGTEAEREAAGELHAVLEEQMGAFEEVSFS